MDAPENRIASDGRRPCLVIVQPYVPAYRIAFFASLIQTLDNAGVDCFIASGRPKKEQLQRGDGASADWIKYFDQRNVSFFGRTVGLGGARKLWANADAVIIGHLGSSVDTYLALWDSMKGKIKVGLWGHIKSYVNNGFPLDIALEKWQLRRADRIFAYMPGGRDYAVANGVCPDDVTTVMNTVDTSRLVESRDALTEDAVQTFVRRHNLSKGRVLGYLGGLDASKRIDFLTQALDHLWVTDPDIKVLIGGQGAQAELLQRAVARKQVVMMGFVGANEQALMGNLSAAFLMPGRVGLVAVDALVLGVPVLTTDWPFHAPEIEYLTEGSTKFTSEDDPAAYVGLIRRIMSQASAEQSTKTEGRTSPPLIEDMVSNFASGAIRLLGGEP